jgi:hypothetical protein
MATHNPIEVGSKSLRYRELDRGSTSFRLLKVLPARSPRGHVQCSMFHTSTDLMKRNYSCLSYVWHIENWESYDTSRHASADASNLASRCVIIVNDQDMEIHRNLFEFLQVAY